MAFEFPNTRVLPTPTRVRRVDSDTSTGGLASILYLLRFLRIFRLTRLIRLFKCVATTTPLPLAPCPLPLAPCLALLAIGAPKLRAEHEGQHILF